MRGRKRKYPIVVYCNYCGNQYVARRKRELRACPKCRMIRMEETASQLHDKEGRLYEEWKRKHREGLLRWAKRILQDHGMEVK